MSRYIYDPNLESERVRISSLQESTDPDTIFTLDQVGIQPGWRCLEVGAGGGSIAKWLAQEVGPEGSVLATDLNTIFLDEIDVPNIEVRKHDVIKDELEPDAFDLVHSRFLLEHLPERDSVLDKLIAATKPGGWVVMEDVDFGGCLWSDPDELMVHPAELAGPVAKTRLGMLKGMQMRGIDPEYGRRLPIELEKRGLQDVQGRGSYRVIRGGSTQAEIGRIGLAQMRDAFIANGVLSAEDFDLADRSLADPSTLSSSPMLVAAWGRKPS